MTSGSGKKSGAMALYCERNPVRIWYPMPENVRRRVEMRRRTNAMRNDECHEGSSLHNGGAANPQGAHLNGGCNTYVQSQDAHVHDPTCTPTLSAAGGAKNKKTKHTIVFRGPNWSSVLKKNRRSLESAFKKDVVEATGLSEHRIEDLRFEFNDKLVATFRVRRKREDECLDDLHGKLQMCSYPRTTKLHRCYDAGKYRGKP